MYYRALQKAGVETQLVIYPDEGHGIKQLPHQADVLRRVLDWFARHDVQEWLPTRLRLGFGGNGKSSNIQCVKLSSCG